MKFSHLFSSLFLGASVTTSALAATVVAPQSRINLWTGSSAIADANFTTGTTTAMGSIKILKSNTTVTKALSSGLDMSSNYLSSKLFYNEQHQSVSENGTTDTAGTSRQCVAFAKAMTSIKGTPNWYQGTPIANYVAGIYPYIKLGNVSSFAPLQPGTMIANFQGLSKYPTNPPYGHVSIFLNWTYDSSGNVTGMNVVDQNLIQSIAETSNNASGLIQKHWLPWHCNAGSQCGSNKYLNTFFAENYHVVDVRGIPIHIILTSPPHLGVCGKRTYFLSAILRTRRTNSSFLYTAPNRSGFLYDELFAKFCFSIQ